MTDLLTKWEVLEEWLHDRHTFGGDFDSVDVAEGLGIDPADASQHIQSYLSAQRSPKSSTLYVIHRTGRTTSSRWHSGIRTADARATSYQYFSDVTRKFERALAPDLQRIAALNPRAARRCHSIIEAVGEGAMKVLLAAVDGIGDDSGHNGGGSLEPR
jgi:hypothetical protein